MSVSTPSASHLRQLVANLFDGPDQPARAEGREVDAAHHSRGGVRGHRLEPPRQIAFVLAAQRVEPERPPDRRRITADAIARAVQDVDALAVVVGRPRPTGVPTVGALGDESVSRRSPLPPINTRGRGRCTARRQALRRPRRDGASPANVSSLRSEKAGDDFDRFGQAVEPQHRAAASSCRWLRTPARTSPAPRPTSIRPPETRSSVASAFARTDAGRSASQNTSVPSRTPRHPARQRGERHDRIETRFAVGRSAVLGQVEEEVVRHPHGVVARRRRALRVVDDRLEPQRTLAGNRVVVLRQARGRGASLEASDPPATRLLVTLATVLECVANVSEGRDVVDAARAGRPVRAIAASTCTPTPTITVRCSRSRGPVAHDAIERDARPRGRGRRSNVTIDGHDGVHPYPRRARRRAVRRARGHRRGERRLATVAAVEFGQWWAEHHGVPVFLYDDADAERRDLPSVRQRRVPARANPTSGPTAPHPTLGATRGRRPQTARRDQSRYWCRDDVADRPPHRARGSASATVGCRACGRSA